MSGIVGFVDRRGSPADLSLLEALTDVLATRGPDGRGISTAGPAALGHTLLRTVRESAGERQPACLDGRLWITADARLDRRAALIAEIDSAGSPAMPRIPGGNIPDGELILRSYAAWGNDCVLHLRGDFAFAIWDAPRRTLFCARDHFGVKPFYYAQLGDIFLLSNTLDCVLAHPGVSDELDDGAIANFLREGFNSDLEATSFRDVRRLPPAHTLVVSEGEVRIERYWSLPVDGRIHYRRAEEYVEHFRSLLRDAVADRLRCDRAGVWMSGGMDSSAVAATAVGLPGASVEIRAYTAVYDSLIPDVERAHAQQVADFLHIPIRYLERDDLVLFGGLDHPVLDTPELVDDPFFAGFRHHHQIIAGDCRVMLSGEGADALMHFQMWPYVRDLFRRSEWQSLVTQVPAFLRVRPFPWRGIRARVRQLVGIEGSDSSEVPDWVSAELIAKRERKSEAGPRNLHPFAPMAHAFLSAPQWSTLFEFADPGATHSAVETRYPFLDLRLVEYLLAIPHFPWAFQKRILREAMAGQLPAAILRRPKTPLAANPALVALGRLEPSYFDRLPWGKESGRYLDRSAFERRLKMGHLGEDALKSLCLNFWLQSGRRIRYKIGAEVRNG